MKRVERMFYVALTIGLLIKFPWLIGIGVLVGMFLLVLLSTDTEEGK